VNIMYKDNYRITIIYNYRITIIYNYRITIIYNYRITIIYNYRITIIPKYYKQQKSTPQRYHERKEYAKAVLLLKVCK
jgi:hypothetical protein